MGSEVTYAEASEYLAVIREMIRHENDLVNQRLGWMFTLQGLLFAAASFWKAAVLPFTVLGLVGILSCISIGYTLARGLTAIKELLAIAHDYKKALPDMVLPPLIGARRKATDWLLPGRLLPWVLGTAWASLLAFRIGGLQP